VFEELAGLPAHPLLVHAAVVFVPLLGVLAAGYALVPLVRPHIRWVLGLLALAAPVTALLAKLSGDEFFARLAANDEITPDFYPTIEAHQDLGNLTLYTSIPLAVLTLALVYVVGPRDAVRVPGGLGPARVWSLALRGLTVVAAAVSLYYVIRTGDSGANAVWGEL